MIKEILENANYGTFAEIALVMFMGIFLVVAWRAWRLDPREVSRNANVVLHDTMEASHRE